MTNHLTKIGAMLAAMLAVAACQQPAASNDATVQDNAPVTSGIPEDIDPTPPVDPVPAAPPPRQSATPKIAPTPSTSVVPASDKTPAAAKKVVEAYFAALSERRYGDAYRLFPGSGMSASAFAASYAKYRTFKATVGEPGDTEGGAGSIYIEIPVVVTGTLDAGGPFRMEGPVALRRVNDVDGATQAQLRWHIFSSALKPRP